MVEKTLNKFTNNFLQKFLLNNCKVDMESKIDINNGYNIENTGKSIYLFR
jgi:hypothetical protein